MSGRGLCCLCPWNAPEVEDHGQRTVRCGLDLAAIVSFLTGSPSIDRHIVTVSTRLRGYLGGGSWRVCQPVALPVSPFYQLRLGSTMCRRSLLPESSGQSRCGASRRLPPRLKLASAARDCGSKSPQIGFWSGELLPSSLQPRRLLPWPLSPAPRRTVFIPFYVHDELFSAWSSRPRQRISLILSASPAESPGKAVVCS